MRATAWRPKGRAGRHDQQMQGGLTLDLRSSKYLAFGSYRPRRLVKVPSAVGLELSTDRNLDRFHCLAVGRRGYLIFIDRPTAVGPPDLRGSHGSCDLRGLHASRHHIAALVDPSVHAAPEPRHVYCGSVC